MRRTLILGALVLALLLAAVLLLSRRGEAPARETAPASMAPDAAAAPPPSAPAPPTAAPGPSDRFVVCPGDPRCPKSGDAPSARPPGE